MKFASLLVLAVALSGLSLGGCQSVAPSAPGAQSDRNDLHPEIAAGDIYFEQMLDRYGKTAR